MLMTLTLRTVSVCLVFLQLDLDLQEADEQVKVGWGVSYLDTRDLRLTPSLTQVTLP